ncbi:hypothetical protein ACFRKB_28880 [Streptomyces scopuliridis]|uniref:hypothetical protein n=1 Tax=Streptomyces scopuliridis TaxID=452529 RepID=UPI003698B5CB
MPRHGIMFQQQIALRAALTADAPQTPDDLVTQFQGSRGNATLNGTLRRSSLARRKLPPMPNRSKTTVPSDSPPLL